MLDQLCPSLLDLCQPNLHQSRWLKLAKIVFKNQSKSEMAFCFHCFDYKGNSNYFLTISTVSSTSSVDDVHIYTTKSALSVSLLRIPLEASADKVYYWSKHLNKGARPKLFAFNGPVVIKVTNYINSPKIVRSWKDWSLPLSDWQTFSWQISRRFWQSEVDGGLLFEGPGVEIERRGDRLHLPVALHRQILRLVLNRLVHFDSSFVFLGFWFFRVLFIKVYNTHFFANTFSIECCGVFVFGGDTVHGEFLATDWGDRVVAKLFKTKVWVFQFLALFGVPDGRCNILKWNYKNVVKEEVATIVRLKLLKTTTASAKSNKHSGRPWQQRQLR